MKFENLKSENCQFFYPCWLMVIKSEDAMPKHFKIFSTQKYLFTPLL